MIRQDPISKFLTLLGISELVVFLIVGGSFLQPAIVAVILLVVGYAFSDRFARIREDEEIDIMEATQLIAYVTLAFATFLFLNLFVPVSGLASFIQQLVNIKISLPLAVSGTGVAFNVLIAISEEQFFRGLFGNIFISRLGGILGSFMNGLWFMLFHIPRYTSNINALTIVLLAGAVLTFIDYRTRRVSTSMLAHILNNLIAT